MNNIKKQEIKRAYQEAKVQMMKSLKEVNRCVRHRLHRKEDIHYGHVGDVHHINDLLKEIITFIN